MLTLAEARGALPFYKLYKDTDLTHEVLYKALLTLEEFYDITKSVCSSPGACGGDCYPCQACIEQAERGKKFFREFTRGS